MYCIVSWHHEGRDLAFWGGTTWGGSQEATFFKAREEAEAELRKVKVSMGAEFLPPNVLDVAAFNERFGRSIGPRPKAPTATAKLDTKTGIVERTIPDNDEVRCNAEPPSGL